MDPAYIRTGSSEEAETLAKSPGPWMVGNLHQSIGWTKHAVTIEYAGRTFLLLPEDEKNVPAIATHGEPDESRRAILEFVSALAWSSGGSVTIEHWTGGSQLFRAGKGPAIGQISALSFQVSYLPNAVERDQKLALALFHEGAGLIHTHVAYSFLSFYKVINLVSGPSGPQQKAWINAHVALMTHHRAKERLAELNGKSEDIGDYLYRSCRCAIAHAGDPRNPVIDPHNPVDQKRLHSDLPLVITLSEIALEEIGIPTSQTVYREHRYELSGFENILAPEVVKTLKEGGVPSVASLEIPGPFSVRMWGHHAYAPLEELTPEAAHGGDGILKIRCKSKAEGYFVNIVLDFVKYRLTAEVFGEDVKDDGTAEFIETTMELNRFFWDWNGNGCLEVWSENECLGRCDAFLPVNVILDSGLYAQQLEELIAEAARRSRRTEAVDSQIGLTK